MEGERAGVKCEMIEEGGAGGREDAAMKEGWGRSRGHRHRRGGSPQIRVAVQGESIMVLPLILNMGQMKIVTENHAAAKVDAYWQC